MSNDIDKYRGLLKAWLPVIALTFSTFVFNTSEFIPIGLLSDISADFKISEARAGLLITVYAWVVALLSLPLMLLVSKMEYRKLMLWVVGFFVVNHILSAFSYHYSVLMISRIGVACSHAIFWSVVSPLAVRVAPEGYRSTALSMVVAGTSIAMIVGLPLGRAVGLAVGWRMTFLCIAILAFLVLIFLAVIFPKVPNHNAISLRKLPSLFNNPLLIGVYVLTAIFVTGQYTGYSYIEPFLDQVAGLGNSAITWVLTAFGLVGIFGSILFSRYYEKRPYPFMIFGVLGVTAFLLLLQLCALNSVTVVLLCVCWGLAITIYNLVFQSEIIQIAPESTAIAMSVYSGIYNVGIGSGALIGGMVCSHLSISYIGYVGGAVALIASVFFIRKLLPLLKTGAGRPGELDAENKQA